MSNEQTLAGILKQNQQTGPQNQSLNEFKQMMQLVKASQNPQAELNRLAQSNPNIAQGIQLCNEALRSGQSLEQLFYFMAKQRGVDPESILSALR